MIKEALKYLIDLSIKPDERVVDITDAEGNNRTFIIDSEGNSKEVKPLITRASEPLRINTLTGLVEYVKANLERTNSQFFLQVLDEKTVFLKGLLDSLGGRETLIIAEAITPAFNYGYFLSTEELIIAFQSKFVPTKDRDLLLKVVGNVKEENVRETGDNGVAQAVTIKTGVASAADVLVPNPVNLAPYRTFLEVEQPESSFIFRMKDGPVGAIFEADGGSWRNQAIANVREYLATELVSEIENKRITIIA
ncbi:hypothetical protein LI012_06315 [Caldibacillus thermoamylovorans]|uniref:hypothetical protein n=1 Tax=Caldibacillus thermoamylovorans TaxID=35841 RepID=UPI001D05CD9A|nr:hypothetical protein [Caldibacillus thermoamylovorans]MCB5934466.1 hypothetical protein [Bacillus sp. DFI.2.34]MCB7076441.1 hypothetical protein [Caldibacillus thermoamylovorans]